MKGDHLHLDPAEFGQLLMGMLMHPCVRAWQQGYRARSVHAAGLHQNPFAPSDETWNNPYADPDLYIEWSDGWNLAFAEAMVRQRQRGSR